MSQPHSQHSEHSQVASPASPSSIGTGTGTPHKRRFRLIDTKYGFAGELARTIFAVAGASDEYDEVRLDFDWLQTCAGHPEYEQTQTKLKAYPFGKIPVLEVLDEGKVIVDYYVIARFLGDLYGLSGTTATDAAVCSSIASAVFDAGIGYMDDPTETDKELKTKKMGKWRAGPFVEWLGKIDAYAAKNAGPKTGFLVADQLTWADLAVHGFFSECTMWDSSVRTDIEAKYPALQALITKVSEEPRVKAHKSKRGPLSLPEEFKHDS